MRKPKRNIRTKGDTSKRRPSSKTSTSKKARRKTGSPTEAFDTGAVGFKKAAKKRAKQEEEFERRKNTPFNFRLKPGEEAEVVVVDDAEPFFVSLHKVKNSRGYWEDEVCIADTGERCPLCESTGKQGSYTMILTILDRRPYTNKQGVRIKASRKLFMVKGRNLPKFERQWKKNKGNLRGLRIACHRSGDKEAAIGEDLEFLGKVPEAKLKKFKELAVAADYPDIFPTPTAKELEERHSLDRTNVAGSDDFDDNDNYDMGDVGWDED